MKPSAPSVPELTVAMPAYNAERFIGEAIDSVLSQSHVDLELIVVDDCSTDATASIVTAVSDPRVRLLRNETRRGIAFNHNRVVTESRAPFIAHVDADDVIVRQDALRTMLDFIQTSDDLGQVHCHDFWMDEHGDVRFDDFVARRRFHLATRTPGRDYRLALVEEGSVMNHLRLYRKRVLLEVGPFDESLRYGEDYEMALRIVERHRIDVVPEVLYAVRKHAGNTTALRFAELRYWWQRVILLRRLERAGTITYTKERRYGRRRLLFIDLLRLARLPQTLRELGMAVYRVRMAAMSGAKTALRRAYRAAGANLSWWPLPADGGGGARPGRIIPSPNGAALQGGGGTTVSGVALQTEIGKVGYYVWHFPVGSQTFVRREIQAMVDQGFPVAIFADAPETVESPDASTRRLTQETTYLDELDPRVRRSHRISFLRRRPVRTLWLFVYTLFRRHGFYKTPAEDVRVFDRAVSLARLLLNEGVTHLHSPWADRCAFIAMIASRLAGIPYSVQARAHDLHRTRSGYGLVPKLAAARFVITNSDYNRDHIVSLLGEASADRVHRVYEGIRPGSFSVNRSNGRTGPTRILTVARLIEEKGLVHLMRAAEQLRSRGRSFRWEVVGGSELPTYASYEVELRTLHRRLKLQGWVTLVGSLPFPEVMERYQASDLFVLPCVVAGNGGRDITPNALLEAMASGLPAVSTTIAAIPEIVTHEIDGLLVEPADPSALADAVERLMDDRDLRVALGASAREKVEEKFNLDRNVRGMARLFAG